MNFWKQNNEKLNEEIEKYNFFIIIESHSGFKQHR